jgi:hypothetical protein
MSPVDPNRLIRVSPAEAIVDPFYENQFSCLDRYTFSDFVPGRCTWSQAWHFLNLRFDVRDGDGRLGSLARTCRIDAAAFDAFRMRLSLSTNVRVATFLTVDGVEQRVVDEPGRGEFRECGGPFRGRTIQAIRLEFHALAPGRAVGMVEWTMLESADGLRQLEAVRQTYDPSWPGYLRDEVSADEMRPTIGLWFGADELESLRRKAATPLYANVMANLRATAAKFLATTPERSIAEVARYLYPFTRDRIWYVDGMPEYYVGAAACGIVGLIDRDAATLRMAARIALSQAFCGSWDAWLDTVPETVWEDRGFPNFIIGVGCALALDWAGCFLTDRGREVIVKALADKALPRVQQSLMKHDYMWYSNQGAWDVYGSLVCSVAIASRWPHGDMFLDRSMQIMNGIVDRYIADDGGAFEGMEYQLHTMAFAMLAAVAYGRLRGRSFAEVASPKLAKAVEYLLATASEGRHPGSGLPLSDGGRVGALMAAHALSLLHRLTGAREIEPLLAKVLPRVMPDTSMRVDNPAALIFGPETLAEGAVVTPRFRILEDSGLLTSSRPTPAGTVRVVLAGCGAKDAGHSHHDRGSLILEAFGESILNETGMIDYQIPEHVLLGEPRYHCIACPGPMDALPRQALPIPRKVVPVGKGDDVRLEAEIDVSVAWGPAVRSALRRIESPRPEELTVVDSFELPADAPVTVIFNTIGTIDEATGGWRLRVGGVVADILPEWRPVRSVVTDNRYNAAGEPCRALLMESAPARSHRLATRIRLSLAP